MASIGERSLRGRLTGWLLAAPLLTFLGVSFYYPLSFTISQSLTAKAGGLTLAHYAAFLGSAQGWSVLWLTLVLSLGATVGSLVLSVPLALVLRRRFRGKSAVQFLMMLPITIPSLVGALGLLILYDRTGWLNWLLVAGVHVLPRPLAIDYTIPGLILFYIWMFFPYGGLVIMSGLGAIDPAIEEAGRVAGGSPAYVFRKIVLPLLKPSLVAGSVMVFLQCFGAFSVPLIAGGNHQPIAVRIYTVAAVFLDWSQASAIAVIMGLVQIALLLAYRAVDGRRRSTA